MAYTMSSLRLDIKKIMQDHHVLCVYGAADCITLYAECKSWLHREEDHYLIFIEEEEDVFLRAKQSLPQDAKIRLLYYQHGDEEIFAKIAWEFLFLKMAHVSFPESKGGEFFKGLNHFQNAVTLLASDWRDMGEKVLFNLVHNLPLLPSSRLGASLKGACKGIPAIVCGAGMSLDQIAPHLTHLKDHAILIAGGTAVNGLNAHGIIPHVCAYVDPNPPCDRFMAQKSYEAPCFYQSRFSSELLARIHGQRIWIAGSGNYPIEEWLSLACATEEMRCETGWTVANFSVFIALHLGCNPILLAGMDFCCSESAIYASGIAGEENREQLITIQDEMGKTRHTKRDWLMSSEWISTMAQVHADRIWINLSDGIPIQGMMRQDLSDVASAHLMQSTDIDAHLHSAMVQISSVSGDCEATRTRIDALKSSFEKCRSYCDTLLLAWQKTFPHSPMASSEYALIEVELDTEIAAQHFLAPLWDMWKYPILRKEVHPLGKHLHRILFYKNAIETAFKVIT